MIKLKRTIPIVIPADPLSLSLGCVLCPISSLFGFESESEFEPEFEFDFGFSFSSSSKWYNLVD